ncbi:MAG: hypothetical protein JOZ69_07645 [Myxococcales bacterium]|nr:hypothetical protein [Myxococcales bacterium]
MARLSTLASTLVAGLYQRIDLHARPAAPKRDARAAAKGLREVADEARRGEGGARLACAAGLLVK